MLTTNYTLSATTTLPFADAVDKVRAELKTEGFGVLCEIDVQATLRERLGVEGEPYLILGACNPPLAHQAVQAEPELGVLLPCNVVVYQRAGQTHISAIDPERMLSIVDNHELRPVAADVKHRLGAGEARDVSWAAPRSSRLWLSSSRGSIAKGRPLRCCSRSSTKVATTPSSSATRSSTGPGASTTSTTE